MLEINLHPDGDGAGSERGRAALPSLEGAPSWNELRSDPWHWIFVACAVLGPLALGPSWYAQRSELSGLRTELERVRADSTRLAGRTILDDSLSRRHRAISERVQRVRSLDRDRYAWSRVLDALGRSLPTGAWLTSLEVERPLPDLGVRVEGTALSPLEIIAYVRALEAAPIVDDVRIRGSRRVLLERGRAHSFILLVDYRRSPPDRRRTRPLPSGRG